MAKMGLLDFFKAKPSRNRDTLSARYDAAQSTDRNKAHWAESDLLSASASTTHMVRQTLRQRARYESANNSYCRGIVSTLANDTIGCGARLQLRTNSEAADNIIEAEFHEWASSVELSEKLRIMRQSYAVDGEAFAIFINNKQLDTPIQLDISLVESDQVSTPTPKIKLSQPVDGIELDTKTKLPRYYHILKSHPGDQFVSQILEYDRLPASQVVHLLNRDRPGQHRGVPEITPALPLFAQLRRFTLAVLESAESAANIAGILKSNAPPEAAASLEPFYPVKLQRGSFIALPDGWDLGQPHAAQPVATYQMFKHELINEIARCLNMPFNVACGNSSTYNYASGRLDIQTYHKSIRVMRHMIERRALQRIFAAWLEEAVLVPGMIPDSAGLPTEWSVSWAWDSGEHVDPLKEASAIDIRLRNNTTTLASEYAKQGKDWRQELQQRAAEQQLSTDLNLSTEETQDGQTSETEGEEAAV